MNEENKPKVDYQALKKSADAQAEKMGHKDVRFDVMDDGTFRRMSDGKDTGRFTAKSLKSGLEARGINDPFLKKKRVRERNNSVITNNQGFDFGIFDDNDDFTTGIGGGGGGGGVGAADLEQAGFDEKTITICSNGNSSTITVLSRGGGT